jgi:hypothetical protein
LGDPQTGELLGLRRFSFRRQTTISLFFEVPKRAGYYNYALYLMSDSYMGLDQQYYVKFELSKDTKTTQIQSKTETESNQNDTVSHNGSDEDKQMSNFWELQSTFTDSTSERKEK